VLAQPQARFRTISLLQGLSQSTVNCIIQDRQGFMWIGTQDGLNRYDGYSFKVYKHNQSNPKTLPDNFIQSLFLDSQGRMWVGTYGAGLSLFDPVTETFTNYAYSETDPNTISGNQVMAIAEDQQHQLWIGTATGLCRFEPSSNKFQRFNYTEADTASLSSDKIRYLYIDGNTLWIGTQDNGLNKLNTAQGFIFKRYTADGKPLSVGHNFVQSISKSEKLGIIIGTSGGGTYIYSSADDSFLPLGEKQSTQASDVWAVQPDVAGNVWIGTYGAGLLRFDMNTGRYSSYRNDPADPSSLGNNIVLCTYRDRQGFIWVGTLGGGVSYFDPRGSRFYNIRNRPSDPNSLNENVVMSIYDDKDKGLYIGTYGGGLNYLDHSTSRFSVWKTGEKPGTIRSNIVRCIFKDSEGRMWIGSYGGGLSELKDGRFITNLNDPVDSSSISANDVWCISEDSQGILWAGTWGGGLNRYDKRTGKFISFRNNASPASLSNDKVISLLIDSKGRIWAGTNGGGLDLFDKTKGTFTHYRHDKDSTTIGSDRVRIIHEDKQGRLWLGTDGGGLCLMNDNGTFQRFNEAHGLPNNVVYGILEDDNGYLWLSTNNGLCRFGMKDHSVRNFDVTDGLQGNEFNQGARFRAADGKMYFGGINGISMFNPNTMASNSYTPPVVLTSVKLFGKELAAASSPAFMKTLELSYDQNFFSFEFSALDYTAPEKNQYSCKMEGFDNDWIYLGNRRFVSYTNLDPGTYTFRVRASNNEDKWNNEGYSIIVIITPPFYKTTLFYILLVVLCIALVYLFIFFRTRRLAHDKRLLENEVSQRTLEVVKQKEIIELKNKDITDSINYARRIQHALFPSSDVFSSALPQSFILYRPKDIVSGDFYWMDKFGDEIFVAVVDCTGHGVPGAFMSIVGNNLLNQAVNELGISRPSLILDQMNKGLAKLVRNQGDISFKDGMDMALCAFNPKTYRLSLAGANNAVWIIKGPQADHTFIEYKGDKKPIGAYASGNSTLFTNHEIILQPGDTVYLFSDGFADQFGGEKGKKFKKSRLKEVLLAMQSLPMHQQKIMLEKEFDEWMGGFEQVDDVLVMGIRV
jgi:ligand-binding sensor domain-containing protein/serine phosphatase RsbU (regulator of sigma subunit)